MEDLRNKIVLVKDNATREIIEGIIEELERIKKIEPATEDLKSLAVVLNKITGKIK